MLPIRHGDLRELSTEAAKSRFPAEAIDKGVSAIIQILKVRKRTWLVTILPFIECVLFYSCKYLSCMSLWLKIEWWLSLLSVLELL